MTARGVDLRGRVAVVTGGYGVLGGSMAAGLAAVDVKVAVLGRRRDAAEQKAAGLRAGGAEAMALVADVLSPADLRAARDALLEAWGRVDILVNAIAPGFFVTTQNRAVPLNEWQCSDAASFVTGAIIPIDGGFSAFSGV